MRMAALAVSAMLATAAVAAQAPKPGTAQTKTPAKKAPAKAPAKASASDAEFNALVAQGTAARQAQHWDEAIAIYDKAVKLRPTYVEGFWYQGTSYYSLDKFAECRDKFREVTRLAPQNGAAYAFLGLCEYGLKDYDKSLQHLLQSRIYGTGDTGDLGSVARFHAATLMSRISQFEQSLETLGEFANEGNDNPRVIEAMGIATLRMPMLPEELPSDRREMVLMAGRASYQMATRNTAAAGKAFEALVIRYPETPNVHYANGVYLLLEQPDKAIDEFKKELELQPDHAQSMMQIAFEYLKRGEPQNALPWAQKAVDVSPKDFASHKALGQALLDTDDVKGAIAELQTGIALAPESPGLHFSLAKAYQKAGRLEEANREREEFTRLDRMARENRAGAQSVGGIGRGGGAQ